MLSEREISNPFIRLELKKGYKYTLIVIEDNDGGIAEEYVDRILSLTLRPSMPNKERVWGFI